MGMRAIDLIVCTCFAIGACNGHGEVLHLRDGDYLRSDGSGTHLLDGDYLGSGSDGSNASCAPWNFGSATEPAWVTMSCPSGGCPTSTTCVHATIAAGLPELGCAPVPTVCDSAPSCACMSCVCGTNSTCQDGTALDPGVICDTQTVSSRTVKADIAYVEADERAALAQQALAIPLARYRYKTEPKDARHRLGFIIEDQPNPSPAVLADRMHVDEYGYTSMLLATVQQQAKELAELRERIDRLERSAPRSTANRIANAASPR
jgi:hypothetical protein